MKGVHSMAVIAKELDAQEALLSKQVFIADGYLVINVEYEYNIELSRCDTLEKIIAWAVQLCEKTWMNTNVLERFMRLAVAHHHLELPNP